MRSLTANTILACLALFLLSCGSVLNNRKQNESLRSNESLAVDVVRQATENPPITVNAEKQAQVSIAMLPATNTVTISQGSTAKTFQTYSLATVLPLSIAAVMLGLGLILILFAIRVARNSSRAVNTAYMAGDNAIGGLIDRLQSLVATNSNPDTLAALNGLRADAEKIRGKHASKILPR